MYIKQRQFLNYPMKKELTLYINWVKIVLIVIGKFIINDITIEHGRELFPIWVRTIYGL